MKRVLFAHQSTIPHYRIPFYNALHKLKPEGWKFDVVYDMDENVKKRFFFEPVDIESFEFPIVPTKTTSFKKGNSRISFQDFIFKTSGYDLIIVEQALNNLSYPLAQLMTLFGKKVALWGHGRQISAINPGIGKKITEWIKLKILKLSDGFFAYTNGIESYLTSKGYDQQKIFVLNNTIDILEQRKFFDKYASKRAEIKKAEGLEGKKVLLFVGRFNHTKRLEFLIESMNSLFRNNDDYRLLIVGDGNKSFFEAIEKKENVRLMGSITDLEQLAPIYCMSDIFTFPGQVGLGPLQAMCYDLPIISIASKKHMPEFEYLNENNSIVLHEGAGCQEFADAISEVFEKGTIKRMKDGIWDSIKEYTLENMARNMIRGINRLLDD